MGSKIPLWSITLSGTYNLMGKPVNVIRRHDREPPRVKRLEWYPETHEVLVELDRANTPDPDIALIPDAMCIKVCEEDALPAVFRSVAEPKKQEPIPEPPKPEPLPDPPAPEPKPTKGDLVDKFMHGKAKPVSTAGKLGAFPKIDDETAMQIDEKMRSDHPIKKAAKKATKKRKPGRPRKKS